MLNLMAFVYPCGIIINTQSQIDPPTPPVARRQMSSLLNLYISSSKIFRYTTKRIIHASYPQKNKAFTKKASSRN
jgi:hypothetical protein